MKRQTYREYLEQQTEKNPILANHKRIYKAYQERISAQQADKYIKNATEKALKEAIAEFLNT